MLCQPTTSIWKLKKILTHNDLNSIPSIIKIYTKKINKIPYNQHQTKNEKKTKTTQNSPKSTKIQQELQINRISIIEKI